VGKWLAAVLRGHFNYYGVPSNYQALKSFRFQVTWPQALGRRDPPLLAKKDPPADHGFERSGEM
ncbi:MAG TPA: hypothetical protein VN894_09675, partial [Polyangiaceae bacterium]|nr:hypothetical protein [Polyangiaceae bacterium]